MKRLHDGRNVDRLRYSLTNFFPNSRFGPNAYPGGGYVRINKEIGHEINWYNVQYGRTLFYYSLFHSF